MGRAPLRFSASDPGSAAGVQASRAEGAKEPRGVTAVKESGAPRFQRAATAASAAPPLAWTPPRGPVLL
ncbi:hypothetical protein NDU88_007595 [Pleurodeles waltl]|uniref:Uncharacterized protein n=1 Tax=Pleurodeles waltl TaxID=8319 RepID=A0AAV7NWQ2_PLEWA|nr:hypothetical protein NDU88_007595 [Pleurodeles waltl]